MEKIPEKFLNEDRTLNTNALIKSYSELEKKMGSMVTIPTSDSDVETKNRFNRAIGVPDSASEYPTNEFFDDENIREKFHEIGLTNNQVEKIYNIAQDFLQPILSDLFSIKSEVDAMNELKNYFGSKEKMYDALQEIKTFGERFLPTDTFEVLCSTPQGIQGIYKMMQSIEPDVKTEKSSIENLTDSDLRRMMRDPKYWRDSDPEYVRKIENGFKKLYS